MARRGRRSSNNGGGSLSLIVIGILLYLLIPKLSMSTPQDVDQNSQLSQSVKGHDAVAIIAGNVDNSPAPKLEDNKKFREAISDVFYNSEVNELPNVVIFSAASEPKTIDIKDRYFVGQAANEIANESNLSDLIKGIEIAVNTSPSVSGADFFACIIEAAEYLKDYENPIIIVYGSGLSDTGVFNFAFNDLLNSNKASQEYVFNILLNDGRFIEGEYSNITVYWFGVGQTVGDQPELKEYKKYVQNIYIFIFKFFGMKYNFYSINVTANDNSVSTEYEVNITPLPTIEEGFTISLNERYLSFYGDSDKLKNEKEVRDLLKAYAEKFKDSDVNLKITGYQTVCAKSKKLSVMRADKVKSILVELGVDASRITTDGVAGPPDDRVENPRCGSTGVAVEHRTVIIEVIK